MTGKTARLQQKIIQISSSSARGRAEGEATAETKIVLNMHNNGLTPEQIAAFTNKNIDDVKAIVA